MFAWNESFTYDNLDRLLSFSDNTGTKNHTYDAQGRITNNSNIGTYTYTGKSYQLASLTLNTKGQALYAPTIRQDISYTAFKSPIEINEAGKDRLSYQYNAFQGRANMFYGNTNSDKLLRPLRRHYSADGSMEISYEKNTGKTTFVTYIGGDAYTAPAIWRSEQNTGTSAQYLYLHRDYLGSILGITDKDGNFKEKRHFDAWGNLVKLTDGNNVALTKFAVFDRGYTGHEHLLGVGLIHMNGRLYDAKIHRFLMPDNFVQDPYNTQNYNRYGYVLNNPLLYVDSSGEFIWFVPLIYAAVNLGVDMILNKGNMNFGQIAMSLGQGALSGALGGATTVGGAFLGAGVGQLNRFMPVIPIYQSSGFNLGISPMIGFGTSGFNAGVSLNASGQVGDFAYGASVGFGFNSGTSSLGESSGWSGYWNAGGFVGLNDGHANYGLGYSYNSFGGNTKQGIGEFTGQIGDFGIRWNNDLFGDGEDRYRTNGLLLSYKVNNDLTLVAGLSMMTGEANDKESGGNPRIAKGMYTEGKMKYLRAGSLYGGAIYKGQATFYGHNSEKRLHDVQNFIHRSWPIYESPYFPDRGLASKAYTYSGSYNSNYLYY